MMSEPATHDAIEAVVRVAMRSLIGKSRADTASERILGSEDLPRRGFTQDDDLAILTLAIEATAEQEPALAKSAK